MTSELLPSIRILAFFTVLTGVIYPAFVTGVSQLVFPDAAKGSLIEADGQIMGSRLLGQAFADPRYFWGRPSATAPFAYNAAASSGSNQGPSNPALLDAVKARVAALRAADPQNALPVPVDLVTASGSGLDPEISPAAAYFQISRVARARSVSESRLRDLVKSRIQGRTFGVLGEPRVNVLELNLALDRLSGA